MITFPAFWQFSLAHYPDQQVALLDWQNTYQANVNLALLCQFLDQQKLCLSQPDLIQLHQAAKRFETQFTEPLRHLRQLYKTSESQFGNYAVIRQHLLAAELEIEKEQQQRLINSLDGLSLIKGSNNWSTYQHLLHKWRVPD